MGGKDQTLKNNAFEHHRAFRHDHDRSTPPASACRLRYAVRWRALLRRLRRHLVVKELPDIPTDAPELIDP